MGRKALTEGTPWKVILAFAIPVLIGNLLQQLYSTVDVIIIGNYADETALAATGTTGCLTMFFLALANGFSAGVCVIISWLYGAREMKKLKEKAITSLLLLFGMGLLASVLGIAFCRPVLQKILLVPDDMIEIAVVYFRIYALSLVFQFGYNVVAAILRGVGDSRASLYFLIVASAFNVILDMVFVAVFRWGAAGAALATGIAQAASCAASVWYMRKKYKIFCWGLKELTFRSKIASEVLKTGFPMALQQVVVSLGITLIQRAVNQFGQAMTASFTVGHRMEIYLTIPVTAFQVTMAAYSGQNMGAGNMKRVKKGSIQVLVLSEFFTVICSGTVFFGARVIAGWFGLGSQAAFYCVSHIRCTAALMLILAAYFPLLGLYQGVGKGMVSTLVAVIALGARVVSTYTLRYVPLFGYRIVWWNLLFGFIGGITITWGYYLSRRWECKQFPKSLNYV